jgi:uncharacterized protein YjdB
MKKGFFVVLATVTMILGTVFYGSDTVNAASGDTTVYITKTGSCYHNSGCSSLSRSCIETTLQAALNKGLSPCSKCHPASSIDSDDDDDDYDDHDYDDDYDDHDYNDDYDDYDDDEDDYISVSSVTLNKKSANVIKGKSITLKATVKPSNATEKTVTWKSNNPKIASVDNKGKVKGLKKGTAKITVKTSNGKSAVCKITVLEPVKSIKFTKKAYSLKAGNTITLKPVISPKAASNKNVTWKTGDKKIATVDKNGKVKGKKKGRVTITVTTKDGKKTAKCTVNVK